MLSDLDILFDAHISQAKSLAAAYQVLLGGVPNISGFTALINENYASNFGAGPGVFFNDENIYINVTNALVQGNPDAKSAFEMLSLGSTLKNRVEEIYKMLVPAAEQTAVGLDYVTRPDALAFYAQVAVERGISDANGPAIVALASVLKIVVDSKIGIGNTVIDLIAAVKDGSAALPYSGTDFTPIETVLGANQNTDDQPTDLTINLTTGTDTGGYFAGATGVDTFVANDDAGVATFSTGDTLNGAGGIDTLNIIQAASFAGVPAGATVTNIENVNITSASTVTIDTSAGFSGLTALTINSMGGTTLNATGITDIATSDSAQANGAMSINGGANIVLSVSGLTTGITNIGNTNVATGDVTVTSSGDYTNGANIKLGDINITGGKTVTVTQTSGITAAESSAAENSSTNFSMTFSDVKIAGDASTKSVSVKGEDHRNTEGAAPLTETVVVTFQNLAAGQSFTLGGLTITNPTAATIQRGDVAQFFSNLFDGSTGNSVNFLTSSGQLSGWTTSPLLNASDSPANTFTGFSTKFTSSTAGANVPDLVKSGSGAGSATLSFHIEGSSQSKGVIGIQSNTVIIDDKNFASLTDTGTISTVTLEDVFEATIRSSALTTLNLSGSNQGFVAVSATSLTAPVRDTLNSNFTGYQSGMGFIITDTSIKTLNINSSTSASKLGGNGLTTNAITSLNISGNAKLDISGTGASSYGALMDINVTNTAGVSLAKVLNVGTNFTGGDGNDSIVVAEAATGMINMGMGNDSVTIAMSGPAWSLGTGGSLNGGDGIDTLHMMTQAAAFLGLPAGATVTNFENVNIMSGGEIILDTVPGFSGMTELNTNSTGGATISSADTNNVTVTETAQASSEIRVSGGKDVFVNSSGLTTGTIAIGNAGAAHNVSINSSGDYTEGSNIALGAISVIGSKSISVTQLSGITSAESSAAETNATNFSVTLSDVNINGDATTTSVSVKGEEHRDAVAGAAALTESVVVNFLNLPGGQSFTIGGLTVTNPSVNTIGVNDVSRFFSDVAEGGAGDTTNSQLISSGKLVGWTTSPLLIASSFPLNTFSGNSTRVTSTTAETNVVDLVITGTGAGTTTLSHHIEGAAQVKGAVGVTSNTVIIDDKNFASTTDAGTISTVTLDDVHSAVIRSSALTTLNLSGVNKGFVSVSTNNLITPTRDTLNGNLNGYQSSVGLLITDTSIKTLNINSSTAASMLGGNGFTINSITTLNVAGDARFNVGGAAGNSYNALVNINVTNSAGVSLANVLNVGTNFASGDGDDSIVAADLMTGSINMGKGSDTVTVSKPSQVWSMGVGGSLNGGDGGTDTIIVNTGASNFAAMSGFSGFEILRIEGNGARDSHNAAGFSALELGNTVGAASSFYNVGAGVGLKIIGSPSGTNTVAFANAGGGSDVFTLELNSSGALNVVNGIVLHGMETINITNTDTDSTAHTNNLKLESNTVTSITVVGNAGLNLTNSLYANVTLFDANGITGAASDAVALGVTYASGNTTGGATVSIKGGTGNDTLTGTTLANDTIVGGGGSDTITYHGGADTFSGGTGLDHFVMADIGSKTAFLTITDISAGETIDFSTQVGVTLNWQDANDLNGAEVTGGNSLNDFLNKAADNSAGISVGANVATKFAWFKFGGDTYMVIDNVSATNTFVDGNDFVIKLTGGVDLSNSMITSADIFMYF